MNIEVKSNRPDRELARLAAEGDAAAFASWLYRLTANLVKMHFRRHKNRSEAQMSEVELTGREAGGAHSASSAPVLEEIARLLSYSAGNSKSQLHRARTKLRGLLSARTPALQT